MVDKKLEDLLTQAQLPALPQSAMRLLELSRDTENGPAEFAVPIESDPGLASQVLRFVNSSYFGFSREISSVKLAITLVGIRTVKNFALWSAVFSLMPNPRCGDFDLKGLWTDSLRRGLFARAFGKALGLKDCEDIFSASLLQDMALPLLARELPKEYREMLEGRDGGQVRLSKLETEQFGWNHADAAGVLARQWNLPDHIVDLLEGHLELDQWTASADERTDFFAVSLSSLLPSNADSAWWDRSWFEETYQKLHSHGLPEVVELFTKVDDEFDDFAPIMQISGPTKSLVQYWEEANPAATT